jgi:site-specific DNA-methyltransferase (adenine-specific)
VRFPTLSLFFTLKETLMPVSEVYNEDNLVGMRRYPDKYFDLAIVDPPYGIKENAQRAQSRTKLAKTRCYGAEIWDMDIPPPEYFDELFRVSKNQIIWGGNYFLDYLGATRCMLVWRKLTTGNFADCELAWTSFKTSVREFTFMWNGILQGRSINEGHKMQDKKHLNEKRIHPTQKPVALYKWALSNYAEPGQKILDTHLGSQSSRIAAFDLGYDFYGWETSVQHFKDGNKRFHEHTLQITLGL